MFIEFEVAMNIVSLKSKSTSTEWSLKVWFCSGSNTSRSAADGSPRKSMPILSISSSRMRGFEVLALRIDWMILPGSDPI